jgi:hypothetical protein
MRHSLYITLLVALFGAGATAQTAGTAGAFARLGFGARGMGMGNAMSAVTSGELSSYYNPAASAFSEARVAGASFGILSLDRSLNFVNYTQAIKPTAGISFGLINAGVRDIDGRDGDGVQTGPLSTYENQFYLSFSNRVDPHVSFGGTIKLYYSKLYEDVKSSTVGFDIGAMVVVTDGLTIGAVIQDINSKYKWDTKAIYGEQGRATEDKFPSLRRLAIAYRLPGTGGLIDAEVENSSQHTTLIRAGAEYPLIQQFVVRAGFDRWDLSDDATGVKPTFGFTLKNSFNGWNPALTYAYVAESFAPHGMHVLTLSNAF